MSKILQQREKRAVTPKIFHTMVDSEKNLVDSEKIQLTRSNIEQTPYNININININI